MLRVKIQGLPAESKLTRKKDWALETRLYMLSTLGYLELQGPSLNPAAVHSIDPTAPLLYAGGPITCLWLARNEGKDPVIAIPI